MSLYRSTQHDDDNRSYDCRDWLLALVIAVSGIALIGVCSWRLLLAVTP